MPYERRPDRRPGGGRPGGSGRPSGDRPSFGDRPPRDRPGFGDRPSFGDRPPRDRGEFSSGPPRERSFGGRDSRPPRPTGFAPRPMDDGGMSIRLDPRRLGALKLLAAEAGLRPGELVTRWVEERLDAARAGGTAPSPVAPDALAALAARVDELYRRLDQIASAPAQASAAAPESAVVAGAPVVPATRGRGRPRKVAVDADHATVAARPGRSGHRAATGRKAAGKARVALHDEIASVIAERGPQTAGELASAIAERGIYRAPRSKKPLDAAQINARVSNTTYRSRFVRNEHRIGLVAE